MKKPLLIIGAVLGSATLASGASVPTSSHELLGSTINGPYNTATPQNGRMGAQRTVDISGISTWDVLGSPNNTVLLVDLAALFGKPAGSTVTMNGIGWHTNQSTVGSSWLSEMAMYFDDNIAPDGLGLFLRPGASQATPGTGTFDSNGVIKLEGAGIAPIVLPNGILRIEFYESFDDVANAIDGNFLSGSFLTIQTTNVPAPGALALLGLAGLVGIRRRRS